MSQQLATTDAPTPEEIAARIADLVALEAADPTTFAEELADNIVDPLAVDTHAFRSDELAFKSFTAATYLIERTNEQVRRHARNPVKRAGSVAFGHKVGRERRILENIVNGLKAKNGVLPAQPNPRRRAKDRLWNEAMTGQAIPAGRWREILDEEIERDKARKREEKRARKELKRGR